MKTLGSLCGGRYGRSDSSGCQEDRRRTEVSQRQGVKNRLKKKNTTTRSPIKIDTKLK